MEREFEVDLVKVVGARLKRDYVVSESALPEPIANELAKLRRAEQAARPPRRDETASEN